MPPEQDDLSSIARARERLYSQSPARRAARADILDEERGAVPHGWMARIAPKAHPHLRIALIFFILCGVFFVGAGILAALLFFTGTSNVSTNNITMLVQGPTSIGAGDTVPLSLAITNHNPVALENATLEIDFPSGSRSATDESQPYPRYTENLGTIEPGTTVLRSVKAVLFGGAGQALALPISLSYQASGSNATFVKKQTYPLTITSAPLSLSVAAVPSAVPGQPFTIVATIRSNATAALQDVVLSGNLPFGFSLKSSSIPAQGSSFLLGTLEPGASQVVTITGTLSGATADTKAFTFTVGTANGSADTAIALPYMSQESDVVIQAPFIATTLSINGDTSNAPVLAPGKTQVVTVTYQNTLSTPIQDATIAVKVAGAAVVPGSIESSTGFYDSGSGQVIFSPTTDASLANFAPGASGLGTFTFSTASGSGNPTITLSVSVSGAAGDSSGSSQTSTSLVETAKVASALAFSATTLHATGPFTNSGPIPPSPGAQTTYAIVWSVSDPGSPVTSLAVSATLPTYVSYTGATNPADGSIVYSAGTRTVTWHPADLSAGQTAVGSFQVALIPSTSQSNAAPVLTGTATLNGFDRFAQAPVSASANPATTETPSDPGYVSADAYVQ